MQEILKSDKCILYSIVASSVTGFTIDASDLRVGENVLAITFVSASGASRTVITKVTKTQGQTLSNTHTHTVLHTGVVVPPEKYSPSI